MPPQTILLIYEERSSWVCSNLPGIPVHADHLDSRAREIDAPAGLLRQVTQDLASIEFRNIIGDYAVIQIVPSYCIEAYYKVYLRKMLDTPSVGSQAEKATNGSQNSSKGPTTESDAADLYRPCFEDFNDAKSEATPSYTNSGSATSWCDANGTRESLSDDSDAEAVKNTGYMLYLGNVLPWLLNHHGNMDDSNIRGV